MIYCGAFPKGSCAGNLASSATIWRGGHFKRAASWELTGLGPLCEGTNYGLLLLHVHI